MFVIDHATELWEIIKNSPKFFMMKDSYGNDILKS